jgi:TM2 domain-containing membrane protein YozV
MHVEVGRLLAQAAANVARASREAAERRHEARKLALENRRLELEAERLARAESAARPAPVPPPVPAGRTIVITHPPVRRWSPGLAAVLSLFLPGLGQLYKGQVFNGIVWFFLVGLGYAALVLPGLVLHFCCILGAASGNPWTEGRTEVVQAPG